MYASSLAAFTLSGCCSGPFSWLLTRTVGWIIIRRRWEIQRGGEKENHFHSLKCKCSCQSGRLKAEKLQNHHADWLANQAVIEANVWLFTFLWWFADSSVPISCTAAISSDLDVLFIIASFECLFPEATVQKHARHCFGFLFVDASSEMSNLSNQPCIHRATCKLSVLDQIPEESQHSHFLQMYVMCTVIYSSITVSAEQIHTSYLFVRAF